MEEITLIALITCLFLNIYAIRIIITIEVLAMAILEHLIRSDNKEIKTIK